MTTNTLPPAAAPPDQEEQDWLDRLVAGIRRRPLFLIPIAAVVVAAALFVNGLLNPSQPIGTDPTVAGRPLSNPGQHLHSLAIDPLHPNTIFLGSHYGLFISTDGGKTWPQARGELNTLMITSLAASPIGEGLGLIGIDPNGSDFGQNGVYFSHDGGVTLTKASDPPGMPRGTSRFRIAAGPASAHDWLVIYVNEGLYETLNDGQSWRRLLTPTSQQEAQRAILALPGTRTIFLGTSDHLDVTFDDGAHWQVATGVPDGVYEIVVSPAAPQTVYASADSGVYRSTDGGHTFARVSGPVASTPLTTLAISQQHAGLLYGLGGGVGAEQVFRSADGGVTWTALPPLTAANPFVFIVSPLNDQRLIMGFYSPAAAIQSLDGGQTWSILTSQ